MSEFYVYILASRYRGTDAREHTLKRWHRDWKFKLIEAQNPD